MKKTHYRDYATDAFRFWAQVGGTKGYRAFMLNLAMAERGESSGSPGSPTEAAISRYEELIDSAAGAVADLEAVERVLARLMHERDGVEIRRAVQEVYMTHPLREPQKGEISERAARAAMILHVDERTIYRWLGRARGMFATERGLRTENSGQVVSSGG